MTAIEREVNMKDLLRWIIKITLVLALALSSSQGSALKSFCPAPVKAELAEIRSSYPRKTACFKSACIKCVSFQQLVTNANGFASALRQYDDTLRVKFKDNFKVFTLLKSRNDFLQSCHCTNTNREESDTDKSKA